ncbi:MAG: class II glutamine amidotransferase [Acidobacteriota bacterium]|nr:class II glutamine amidotransferase [Acidobacteriota bacterium]MDH3783703.1 class II glutamine amidotransferase [Acidobacteriota bacterium]
MCRVLAYLGEPVVLDQLLFRPDSSLIQQTYAPRMAAMLNLAGFGLIAWDSDSHNPSVPFTYRTTAVPVFDRNLERLAEKLRPGAFLAHVRGVPYHTHVTVNEQNLHPFQYEGTRLAMAHNGQLEQFDEMRYDLVEHIRPVWRQQILGNSDSEWIYALFLSQLGDPSARATPDEIARAVEGTLRILRATRARLGITTYSPINLFISDGVAIVAVRFAFDFGCYSTEGGAISEAMLNFMSLWYTCGRNYGLHDGEWKMIGGPSDASSIIVSSEPLSEDRATWLEVPEYTMLAATLRDGVVRRDEFELDI